MDTMNKTSKEMKKFMISCLESRIEEDGVMYGRFLFGQAPRGLGVTIATALRRSLLSEVSGYAITHVEFCGPEHEYSTIPGTQETVLDVLLNLKKLHFTSTATKRHKATGYCAVRGPGVITGRDLQLPPGMQCTNPDHVIARLAQDGHLYFSIIISRGENYVIQQGTPHHETLRDTRRLTVKLAELKKKRRNRHNRLEAAQNAVAQQQQLSELGVVTPDVIPERSEVSHTKRKVVRRFSIDAVFMPVLKVNYLIQSDEDVLEFPLRENSLEVTERVVFEIWTNGNVTPRAAMHQAATHLIRVFSLFQISAIPPTLFRPALLQERVGFMALQAQTYKNPMHRLQSTFGNDFLYMDIGILPLSPALYAALKSRHIERLCDFIGYTYAGLLQIPGMSSEVAFEVVCVLRSYGLRFLPDYPDQAIPPRPPVLEPGEPKGPKGPKRPRGLRGRAK